MSVYGAALCRPVALEDNRYQQAVRVDARIHVLTGEDPPVNRDRFAVAAVSAEPRQRRRSATPVAPDLGACGIEVDVIGKCVGRTQHQALQVGVAVSRSDRNLEYSAAALAVDVDRTGIVQRGEVVRKI